MNSGAVHCLNGNLLYALQRLGFGDDERVQRALDWQARAITGEGDFKYLKSATCGLAFACSVNERQRCSWGANKAMRALLAVPPDQRTPVIERAIQAGTEFLLSRDPAVADYPYTTRVSSTWFKFGFPLSYWSDALETTAVLVEAGYAGDPRLANALQLILSKQDDQGRWKLENSLNGKWCRLYSIRSRHGHLVGDFFPLAFFLSCGNMVGRLDVNSLKVESWKTSVQQATCNLQPANL